MWIPLFTDDVCPFQSDICLIYIYIYIYIFIFCSIYIQYIASFKASLATLPKVVGQKTRVQGDTLISHVENLTLHLYSNALYIGLI